MTAEDQPAVAQGQAPTLGQARMQEGTGSHAPGSAHAADLLREVERIEVLMEKATPGEWNYYGNKLRPNFGVHVDEVQDVNGEAVVAWGGFDATDRSKKQRAANAKLIAALHNVFPALAASARREARLEALLLRVENTNEPEPAALRDDIAKELKS